MLSKWNMRVYAENHKTKWNIVKQKPNKAMTRLNPSIPIGFPTVCADFQTGHLTYS